MSVDQMAMSVNCDRYFDDLPEDRRALLGRVRRSIERIWPHVDERLVAGIPTYHLDGHPLLSMADRKNYIALYIVPHDLLNAFKTELRQYDHGRSCIRFKKLDQALFELIERIIMYTGSQLNTSKFFKKGSSLVEMDDRFP
ncbi:MAG: DUF1801 domain-containing protein [Bacteroidota bacterium]|nr:DUF1801 domain-containing protein [Bacteroidota bacterium]